MFSTFSPISNYVGPVWVLFGPSVPIAAVACLTHTRTSSGPFGSFCPVLVVSSRWPILQFPPPGHSAARYRATLRGFESKKVRRGTTALRFCNSGHVASGTGNSQYRNGGLNRAESAPRRPQTDRAGPQTGPTEAPNVPVMHLQPLHASVLLGGAAGGVSPLCHRKCAAQEVDRDLGLDP